MRYEGTIRLRFESHVDGGYAEERESIVYLITPVPTESRGDKELIIFCILSKILAPVTNF